jgi:hypothetical protein
VKKLKKRLSQETVMLKLQRNGSGNTVMKINGKEISR